MSTVSLPIPIHLKIHILDLHTEQSSVLINESNNNQPSKPLHLESNYEEIEVIKDKECKANGCNFSNLRQKHRLQFINR